MTKFLASVTNAAEARIAVACDVDIIDAKEPRHGALGAVSPDILRAIVAAIAGQAPVSATLGDLPMEPDDIAEAACRTAAAGVDYVKFGIFEGGDAVACAEAACHAVLEGVPGANLLLPSRVRRRNEAKPRLIAVLFADLAGSRSFLNQSGLTKLKCAGIHGIMIDTAGKDAGNLWSHVDAGELAAVIASARRLGLLCGLAGSLRKHDIERLLPLQPDILGFRGALCMRGERSATLSPDAVLDIRSKIPAVGFAGGGIQAVRRGEPEPCH